MKLKDYLDKNNITYTKCAEDLNVSRVTIWKWFVGIHAPTSSHFKKIKKYTNGQVTYEDMLED